MKKIRNVIVALMVLAVAGSAAYGQTGPGPETGQPSAVVKSVSYAVSGGTLDAAIAVTGPCTAQTLVLDNPSRLVVDLSPAGRIEAKAITEVNAFGLTNIRTGMFQPTIARIIFDFSGPIPPYELQKTDAGYTVRFTRPEEVAAKPAEKPAEKPAQKPAAAPPVKEKAAPAVRQAQRPAVEEAPAAAEEKPWPQGFYNMSFAVFGGTYSNTGQDFTDVYGSETSLQYGLNLTRTLLYAGGFQVDATAELRTFSKTGKATLTGDESTFSMTPFAIGGRILYQTKYVMPYLGFGADFYSYEETSALHNTTGTANGAHFQAGLYVIFPKVEWLRLKLYYKYTKITAAEEGIDVMLGGPQYGVGIAFGFNVLKPATLVF